MSLVPSPVPLPPPPGSPCAVEDAAQDTAAAARLLDELAGALATARTPVWQGDDADAAEARRDRIARIAGDGAEALHRVAARLAGHAVVLSEVIARIAVLQAAQDDEFAVARSRVAVPLDPSDPTAADPEDVLAALRAAEADRAAEHSRLTARVDEDAVETGRVLSAAAAVVAGTPRYDPDSALLRLAALLPAWGTPEVAHRGRLLALAVSKGDLESGDLVAAAAEDLDLATDRAYAAAFLDGLDARLVEGWLVAAWSGATADDPRTDLLARVLSGMERDSTGPPWLAGLLDGLRATDGPSAVAGGLGAVLARAKATGLAGPPPRLAAAWFGSLVREERATSRPTDLGVPPAGADPAATDPLALLAGAMVEQRAALEAARAMSDPDAWAVVLSRTWNDPALRDALVTTVADAPAGVALPALRDALVALGTGLADGDPADWPFDEDLVPRVAPIVGTALLRHPDVIVGPLAAVATGVVDSVSAAALRGLAVTVALDEGTDRQNRGHLGDRIARALSAPRPGALDAYRVAGETALSAAFVGVREHGARLAHCVEQFGRKADAEAKAELWDATFGVGFTLAGAIPRAGLLAGPVETVVTHLIGADGSYTTSPDRQRHHSGLEAVEGAVSGAEPSGRDRIAVAHGALMAYERTLHVLGTPVAPVAPSDGLTEKLLADLAEDLLGEVVGHGLPVVHEDLRGTVGGVLVDAGKELVEGSD